MSQTYNTLLCGKSVTFEPIEGSDDSVPGWAKVVLEGNVKIIGMKKVGLLALYFSNY